MRVGQKDSENCHFDSEWGKECGSISSHPTKVIISECEATMFVNWFEYLMQMMNWWKSLKPFRSVGHVLIEFEHANKIRGKTLSKKKIQQRMNTEPKLNEKRCMVFSMHAISKNFYLSLMRLLRRIKKKMIGTCSNKVKS